jgi:hypothetical protein
MQKLFFNTKLILICFFTVYLSIFSISQCCPYVGELKIIPENPTIEDSVYVITTVTTPNYGFLIDFHLENTDTDIKITACYFVGAQTQPKLFVDTIPLGLKSANTYNVEFIAIQSGLFDECIEYSSNSADTTFSVGYVNVPILKPESKKIEKILNIFGEETIFKPNVLLFYKYNDGTIEKIIRLE